MERRGERRDNRLNLDTTGKAKWKEMEKGRERGERRGERRDISSPLGGGMVLIVDEFEEREDSISNARRADHTKG